MLYHPHLVGLFVLVSLIYKSIDAIKNDYEFVIENVWLTMNDGVRLSATLSVPVRKRSVEKFPVLLEYKPYRKDDNSFNSDRSTIVYLSKRGFIVVNVDIRGTGSSEGFSIDREYTKRELDDCEQIIEQFAKHSHSNGHVGMYGLSWSAFNSLMMATFRKPAALRAIFLAHASDDLYRNDIHYPDGIMHYDHYIPSMDHWNALPPTPNYIVNDQWIKERFTTKSWADIYLENQLDGSFWRNHSVKYAYKNITLPIYIIGGIYDPYKDVGINIYNNARQTSPKIKVVIGPFGHAMPDNRNRNPGPIFDSKAEMVRWFNYWLNDEHNNGDFLNEPDITLFIRTSLTTGYYRYESQWPIPRQRIQRMYMCQSQRLSEYQIGNLEDIDTLEYRPWVGFEGGQWLGGLTEDQQPFDDHCLIYESDHMNETIEITGFINVSLQVSTTAPLAHWIIRFEDVDIDGRVWLVTSGATNGAHQHTEPSYLKPNQRYNITIRLRFTTWTFFPGHRMRIAISNAMFPTYWPTPFTMNTSLFLDPHFTFIDLPILSPLPTEPSPPLFTQQVPPIEILTETTSSGTPRVYQKYDTNVSTIVSFQRVNYELLPNHIFMSTIVAWNFTCSHLDPADTKLTVQIRQAYVYDMNEYTTIGSIPMSNDKKIPYPAVSLSTRRYFELQTDWSLRSDQDYFYIDLKRELFRPNGTAEGLSFAFTFRNKHKRQFQ